MSFRAWIKIKIQRWAAGLHGSLALATTGGSRVVYVGLGDRRARGNPMFKQGGVILLVDVLLQQSENVLKMDVQTPLHIPCQTAA